MKYVKRVWHYLILEPLKWLFYCCFQPTTFKKEFEIKSFWQRVVPMIRLALPIFLVSFPFVLAGQFIPCEGSVGIDFSCHSETTWNLLPAIAEATVTGVGLGVIWGIVGSIRWGIVGGIALGIVYGIAGSTNIDIIRGITVAIGLALVGGMIIGSDWGIVRGIWGSIVGGTAWGIMYGIVHRSTPSFLRNMLQGGVEVAIIFMGCYLVGYYRLLLYPVSGLSGLRAYLSSRKNPPQVFSYLHYSSLYWDERIFLPLSGLKRTLLIAAEQNTEQALRELSFIMAERPLQRSAAQAALLEIAIRDLERRDTIRAISRASQRLTEILPQEAELIDPRWVTPFARLSDASRNAARYSSPLGRQARRDALEEMIANLESVYPYTAFKDTTLAKRLGEVVNIWQNVARAEQRRLEQEFEKIGQIDNPYIPGQALELRNSLFVGRQDLVQQLGEALSRGTYRPTFLLTGERRMGKTSTLKQLSDLHARHFFECRRFSRYHL